MNEELRRFMKIQAEQNDLSFQIAHNRTFIDRIDFKKMASDYNGMLDSIDLVKAREELNDMTIRFFENQRRLISISESSVLV